MCLSEGRQDPFKSMGSSPQQGQMLPPLSIEQIAKRASEYDFDPLVPLRYWLRSATSLVKEVSTRRPSVLMKFPSDARYYFS